MNHVKELNRMGANITLKDNIATVVGLNNYNTVVGSDLRLLRTSSCRTLNGKTIVRGLEHLERGYEDFLKNYKKLRQKSQKKN